MVARASVRVVLWLTIAFPVAWATLWLFEQLILAGTFGEETVVSVWLYVAWIAIALAVGSVAAHGGDRMFVKQRGRSRRLGR